MCEAVPGAKGATRRRKVPGVDGARDATGRCGRAGQRQVWDMWEKAKRQECGEGSGCWEPSASETLGHFLSPVAAHSVPFWGGVT